MLCQIDSLTENPLYWNLTKWDYFYNFVLISYVNNWPWLSRSNLTSNSKLTPSWVCPNHYSSPIQVNISKFGSQMHCSTVKILINSGLDWPWTSHSFSIPKLFFCIVVVCIGTVKQSHLCFNAVHGLLHSLYTSVHGERTAKVEWGFYYCSA